MIHAYDEIYLEQARGVLAGMLDYAMSCFDCSLSEFFRWFLASEYAEQFAQGDCSIVAGKSGAELACDVFYSTFRRYPERTEAVYAFEKSAWYWTGWALAYYQWQTGYSFYMINQQVTIDEVFDMYPVYHEMDILQFVDEMNRRMKTRVTKSGLKQVRRLCGYSQRFLSEQSGVPVRTIQQYEQGQKDIRKASVITLVRLSKVLGCNIRDIL